MIRAPKSTRMISKTASLPAPIGGLNARDAVANMPPTDAVIMDDFFPGPSSVDLRNGYQVQCTGLSDAVETLAVYNGYTDSQLFGVAGGDIYDVSVAGVADPTTVTGLGNSRFQHTNFGTAGGLFLYMVNGDDPAQLYNGTAWQAVTGVSAPIAITGVATDDLISVNVFKNRVWFIEKQSMSVWYLPVASVGGAATELDLSPQFRLGGYLMFMANWTIDNSAGVNDYAVFGSSNGEVLVYQGTDPSTAGTWSLVGTFRIGAPIGRRCVMKTGSDLVIICADGAIPLSQSLLTDRAQPQRAISDKITNLINADIKAYQNNFGWQPFLYPLGQKIIINVPTVENVQSFQYVMNTISGAWCRFTGWNMAISFEFFEDGLYFGGSDGIVYQADVGQSDNGADISADVLQAYNYFQQRSAIKDFRLIRPIITSPGNIMPAIAMNMDFKQTQPNSSPSFSGSSGSLWDISLWDVSPWASGENVIKNWQSITGLGYAAGIRMQIAAQNIGASWQSTDLVYEQGGVL